MPAAPGKAYNGSISLVGRMTICGRSYLVDYRCFGRTVLAAALALVAVLAAPLTLTAAPPHEDPGLASATPLANVELLRYLSRSLDLVLARLPDEVESMLSPLSLANVPAEFRPPTASFTAATVDLAGLLQTILTYHEKLALLLQASNTNEANRMVSLAGAAIIQAYDQVGRAEEAVQALGEVLDIAAASSGEKQVYHEILAKLEEIRALIRIDYQTLAELLQSYDPSLIALLPAREGVFVPPASNPPQPVATQNLQETRLTLALSTTRAYVGETVACEGTLTTPGLVLSGRTVDLVLDAARVGVATTDAQGRFRGQLTLPYRYVPEVEVYARYTPQGADAGKLRPAESPRIRVRLLYVTAGLTLTLPDVASSGRSLTVTGNLDYGQDAPAAARPVAVYLGDTLLAELVAGSAFQADIRLADDIKPDSYILTVTLPAQGRYAPAQAKQTLAVVQAATTLELQTPGLVLIPGSFDLRGRLHTEFGPVAGAEVRLSFGRSQVSLPTDAAGEFRARLSNVFSLGLVGRETLTVQATPRQPWEAPTVRTYRLFTVNVVNLALVLAAVLAAGFWVRRRARQAGEMPPPPVGEPVPVVSIATGQMSPAQTAALLEEDSHPEQGPLHAYRLALKLLHSLRGLFPRPQQTLREFAAGSQDALGPAGPPFRELTEAAERLYYGRRREERQEDRRSHTLYERVRDVLLGKRPAT